MANMNNLLKDKLVTASVVAIHWERIHLFLDVKVMFKQGADREMPLAFYAVNQEYRAEAQFKVLGIDGDIYHLKVNVTNNGNKECIPVGTYKLLVCEGENILAEREIGRAHV